MVTKKVCMRGIILMLFLICCTFFGTAQLQQKQKSTYLSLNGSWKMKPSQKNAFIDSLAAAKGLTDQWLPANVPGTIMSSLVSNGLIADPFWALNLQKIPQQPFQQPWFFEKEFELQNWNAANEELTLVLNGINYRADIWINHKKLIDADSLFGAYRIFKLDVSSLAKSGKNVLTILVHPPQVREFYMGFVDWAPTPPDHFMGIFRDVELKRSSKNQLLDFYVQSDLQMPSMSYADLRVEAAVQSIPTSKGLFLQLEIGDIKIKKRIESSATQTIRLTSKEFAALHFKNPSVWWPNGMGEPNLYKAKLSLFTSDGTVLDCAERTFGIRKIETYLDANNSRRYTINGKFVQIKGAGWVDDLFLTYNPAKDSAQIAYVKDMHLNALRLEGVWGNTQHLYDLCDKNGILLMVGWSCQWEWPDYLGLPLNIKPGDENIPINAGVEKYAIKLTDTEKKFLAQCFKDQVLWLRQHPGVLTWVVGSDAIPPPDLEQAYRNILKQYADQPLLVSAGEFTSSVSGPSGMKMNGPYQYVPPVYWFEDKKLGGPFGFNSEIGNGPQVPLLGSIKKFIPADKVWPVQSDSTWNYHAGRKDFSDMNIYIDALNKRYGAPSSIDEFAYKAQMINYETTRAMYEAHVAADSASGGLIQWMLNAPWPKFYWQLYDYYLTQNGAYYGVKQALSSGNLVYNYYTNQVCLPSAKALQVNGYSITVKVYNAQSKKILDSSLQVKKNVSTQLIDLSKVLDKNKDACFIDLRLVKKDGSEQSHNFYWISNTMDTVDWKTYSWFYSPSKSFADFLFLNQLPQAALDIKRITLYKKEGCTYEKLIIKNNSSFVSFFNELQLFDNVKKDVIAPVIYSENYFSLLPKEERIIYVHYPVQQSGCTFQLYSINGGKQIF